MKKEKVVDAVILEDNTDNQKPYFFPRLIAYFIDIIIVTLVCSGLFLFLPKNENYDKYMVEYESINNNYLEQKITIEEYYNQIKGVVYDIDYSNVLQQIVEILLVIVYFIVFQFYNNGQTFGKKLMKIKVVSTKGSLTLNQVALRALIINTIFIDIMIVGCLLFLNKDFYFYFNFALQGLSTIILVITLIMILFRKDGRGLHDVISNTKVIQER